MCILCIHAVSAYTSNLHAASEPEDETNQGKEREHTHTHCKTELNRTIIERQRRYKVVRDTRYDASDDGTRRKQQIQIISSSNGIRMRCIVYRKIVVVVVVVVAFVIVNTQYYTHQHICYGAVWDDTRTLNLAKDVFA